VGGEAIWVPTALLPRFGVDWSAADDHHLTARWRIDTHEAALELVVDDQGRLREAVFRRWGDPDQTGTFGLYPCGAEVTAYATFGGVSVPPPAAPAGSTAPAAGRRASSSDTGSPRWSSSPGPRPEPRPGRSGAPARSRHSVLNLAS
jgi:hypothetical protein